MSALYVVNLEPNLGSRVLAAGHVVQVVQAEYGTESITSSTSFVDTGLYATITPTNTSSKILVNINAAFFCELASTNTIETHANITRNGTGIKQFNRVIIINATTGAGGVLGNGSQNSLIYLDSPASTSALTYKLQISASNTSMNSRINKDSVALSTITLMEIAQ